MTQMANMYFYFLFLTCFVVLTTAKEETTQQLILTRVSRSPSASHGKREALKSLTPLNSDLVNKRIMTKATLKHEADRTLVESGSKNGHLQSLIAADEDVTIFIQNATDNDTKGYTDKVLKNNTYDDKHSPTDRFTSAITPSEHNATRDVPSYATDTHYDYVTGDATGSSTVSVPTTEITSKTDNLTMEYSTSYDLSTPVSNESTRKHISHNTSTVGISTTQTSVTSPITQPSMTSPITTTVITSDTVKLTTETFYDKSTPVSDNMTSEHSSPAFITVRKSTTRASVTSPVTQPPMTSSITKTVNVCDGMCNQGQCILLKNKKLCECGKYFHGAFCQFVHLDLVDYTVYGTSITIYFPEPLPFNNFVFKYYEKYNPRQDVMERDVTSSTTPVSEVSLPGLKGGMVQYIICIISKNASEQVTASSGLLFDLYQENVCLSVKTGFSKSDPYTVAFYITGTLLVFVLVVIFLAQFVLDLDRTIERNSQKTFALQKLKKMSRRFTKRHAGGKEFRKPQPTALATVSPPPHEEYHPDLSTDTSDIDGNGPVKMLRRFSKRVVSGRKASQNYPLVRMTRLGQKSRPSEVGPNQREMQAHRAVPPAKPPRKGPIMSRPNSTRPDSAVEPPRKDPMKLKPDSGGCYLASVNLENEQRRPKKVWARKVVSSAVPHKMYNFENKIQKQMQSEELVVKAVQRQHMDAVKLGANNLDNPQRRPPNRMKKGQTRYLISNEGLRHGVRCSEQDIEDADRRAKYFSRVATPGGVVHHNKAPRAHKRLIHNHRQSAEDSEPLQADRGISRIHNNRGQSRPTERLTEDVGKVGAYSSRQLQSKNKRLVENGAVAAPTSYVNRAFEYGSSIEEETSFNDRGIRGMERSSPTFKGVAGRCQGFPKSPTRSDKHDREDIELHLNDGKRHGLNISPPSAEDLMAGRRHGVAGRRPGYPGSPQRRYQYDRERVIASEHQDDPQGTESDGTSNSNDTYPDYESDSVHEEAIPYDNHMFTPITSQTSNLENSKPLTSRADDGHDQLANDSHCATPYEVGSEDNATPANIEVDLDVDAPYSSFQTGRNRRSKRPRILAMSPEFSPICEFEEMCGDYSASDEESD